MKCNIRRYEIPDEAGGITQSLTLAKDFVDDEYVAVILEDNIYDYGGFDVIMTLKPSGRSKFDITDVNNEYIRQKSRGYYVLDEYLGLLGTFGSLLRAGLRLRCMKKYRNKTGADV